MKIGIKCEIHDCTITLIRFFENEGIVEEGISNILEKDKELRIDNHYYLKNKPVDIDFDELSNFMLSIKKSLNALDAERIKYIRKKINDF
jgi:hypothetical protein